MTKQLELQAEYDKPAPDISRIASIKKDIIDLQAKIQVAADKYGIPAWGPGGGMMGAAPVPCTSRQDLRALSDGQGSI